HGAARTEETCIDNIEIVELMRFAIAIERARLRIVAEADRAVLVRYSGKRDALAEEQVSGEKALVALVPVDRALRLLLHQALKLFDQAFVSFFVVRLVLQNDLAIAIDRDPVVRIGQIFRSKPKVE